MIGKSETEPGDLEPNVLGFMGEQGWELVNVLGLTYGSRYYFKRPIEE